MINQSTSKNVARYYALLLICAFLPQIIPGGELAKLLMKAVVVLVFAALILGRKITTISAPAGGLVAALIISTLISFFANEGSLLSTLVGLGISCITILFFYDSALRSEGLSKKDVLSFYRIFTYFVLVSCFYNMIINRNGLMNLYSLSLYGDQDICSFFDNKNTFGVILLFGVLAATILKQLTGEKRWLLISLVFLLNELMAMCRTAILLSVLLLLLSYLWAPQKFWKKLISVAVLAVAVLAATILFPQLRNFLENTMFGDTRSLDTRNEYINNLLPNIRGIHVLLGYGDANVGAIAYYYTGNTYFHNTYLAAYTSGGLIRLGYLLWCVGLALRYSFRLRKRNAKEGNLCLISVLVYCIYCLSEAVMLFDSEMIAMTATAFVVAMPILLYQNSFAWQTKQMEAEYGA